MSIVLCRSPQCQTSAGCVCSATARNPAPNAAAPVSGNFRTLTIGPQPPAPPVRMTEGDRDAIEADLNRDFALWGGEIETERRFRLLLSEIDALREENGQMRAALQNALSVWAAVRTLYGSTVEQMRRALSPTKDTGQ